MVMAWPMEGWEGAVAMVCRYTCDRSLVVRAGGRLNLSGWASPVLTLSTRSGVVSHQESVSPQGSRSSWQPQWCQ